MCFGGFFFFQAEDGIRDLVRSRGLGDVYKRQVMDLSCESARLAVPFDGPAVSMARGHGKVLALPLSLIHI